jgi:hypothetical protein
VRAPRSGINVVLVIGQTCAVDVVVLSFPLLKICLMKRKLVKPKIEGAAGVIAPLIGTGTG